MADSKNLTILQGKTFVLVVRWESEPIQRRAITNVTYTFGAPRLTVVGHGIPDGWRGAVYGIVGPKQLNADNSPPRSKDYLPLTVVDADTLELNTLTPVDEQGNLWPAYVSGGFVQFYVPVGLSGLSARMDIKDRVGGTELLSLTTENNRIALDDVAKTITLTISATDTEAITWRKGVYDLELVSGSGVVTAILTGSVSVTREVTTV